MVRPHKSWHTTVAAFGTMLGSITSLSILPPVLAQDQVNLEPDLNQQNSSRTSDEVQEPVSAPAIDFSLSIVQTLLGQISGDDGTPNFPYGGAVNLFLSFNGEKIGFWEGLSLDLHYVETFGDSPSTSDSALFPVNTAFALLRLEGDVRDLSAVLRQREFDKIKTEFSRYECINKS